MYLTSSLGFSYMNTFYTQKNIILFTKLKNVCMKTLPVYLQISTRENQTDKRNLLGDQCFRGRMGHKNDDKARKI